MCIGFQGDNVAYGQAAHFAVDMHQCVAFRALVGNHPLAIFIGLIGLVVKLVKLVQAGE